MTIFGPLPIVFRKKRTKFLRFCNKFQVKSAKCLSSKCTKLLLRLKPVEPTCLPFFKNKKKVRTVRANETKLTSRNAFIVDLFGLESGKEPRNGERTLFWDSKQSLDLSRNPQPPNHALAFFRTTLVLNMFWPLPIVFRKKTKFIRFCTKFHVKPAKFLSSKCTKLLLACTAKLSAFFSKI